MGVEVMGKKLCGKVAKNRVEYGDGRVIWLCVRHFSKGDIQSLVSRKLVKRNYVEESGARCEAEVGREKGEG